MIARELPARIQASLGQLERKELAVAQSLLDSLPRNPKSLGDSRNWLNATLSLEEPLLDLGSALPGCGEWVGVLPGIEHGWCLTQGGQDGVVGLFGCQRGELIGCHVWKRSGEAAQSTSDDQAATLIHGELQKLRGGVHNAGQGFFGCS